VRFEADGDGSEVLDLAEEALGQVAVAIKPWAEDVVQPDGVADDLGGELIAVGRVGSRLYAVNPARLRSGCQTWLP